LSLAATDADCEAAVRRDRLNLPLTATNEECVEAEEQLARTVRRKFFNLPVTATAAECELLLTQRHEESSTVSAVRIAHSEARLAELNRRLLDKLAHEDTALLRAEVSTVETELKIATLDADEAKLWQAAAPLAAREANPDEEDATEEKDIRARIEEIAEERKSLESALQTETRFVRKYRSATPMTNAMVLAEMAQEEKALSTAVDADSHSADGTGASPVASEQAEPSCFQLLEDEQRDKLTRHMTLSLAEHSGAPCCTHASAHVVLTFPSFP
jgi:hypothetical protein